jgi:2,4-dienoyl-CoA reductase (NADPH2)
MRGEVKMAHERFKIRSLEELKGEIDRLGLEIPVDGKDLSILAVPVEIGAKTAPNRFVVQPMEGFDSDAVGAPQDLSFRRYERYARGGSGIIWFEATAVLPEARSNSAQLHICPVTVETFKRLVERTREVAWEENSHEVILILQLTHSGRYSKPRGFPEPIIAHHSAVLDPVHNLPSDYPLASDSYLDRLQEIFVKAAELAAYAGFDGIDVKSCHRYLVSELLASFTREGRYGGSLENRSRLLLETLKKIKESVGGIFVTTRINAFDGIEYPYGFGVDKKDHSTPDLTEPLEVIGRMRELGVPLLNVSVGNPYFNPHIGRPYDFPIVGVEVPDEHPLFGIDRFIKVTAAVQKTFPDLPVIAGGYTWLRHFMPYVATAVIKNGGATLIGQGRGAFAYPDSPNDIIHQGEMNPRKCCVTCSGCTQLMRDSMRTGCVVRDSEIYGPEYRLGRRFSLDRLKEEAERCRDCEFATCTLGCPAGVDVPKFIKAFAKNDIELAYNTLKKANVLPEMCAYVCPAEVQCEGGCLENIFCENPIAIRDIQRHVARAARLKGLTGVEVPERETGKTVAVIGGGPTGIACAIKLLELGHRVDILEARSKLGGTPEGLIPDTRLSEADAAAEIEAILAPALAQKRLTIHYNSVLGKNLSLAEVQQRYDATFIAIGLGGSSSLGHAEGVVDALAFLANVKTGKLESLRGKVAVLGAGNTAMDAGTQALELGAEDVYIVYRRSFLQMPAWKTELAQFLEAGGHFLTLSQPVGYVTDESGKLSGLRVARTELGALDSTHRRKPHVISRSESVLPVDLVVEAIGQSLSEDAQADLKANGVTINQKGLIEVDRESFSTTAAGVFSAGDAINGGTTAVQGISEGMKAAEAIDRYIQ